MSQVVAVDFVVSSLGTSVKFFREILDFTECETTEEKGAFFAQLYHEPQVHARRTRMRLGKQEIFLTEFIHPRGKLFPKDSISTDLWFQHIAIVVSDMDRAHQKLVQYNVVPISKEPQTIPEWNKTAAGIKAFYFRSPDHHPLELISYPKGKGCQEWQVKDRLFLGIDHTAIAVSDTKRSLKFYEELLGLHVKGESLNYGETQERLTAILGAKVQITGLSDKEGKAMGLEFLHYLEGKAGRASAHASHDLSATKTVIETPRIEEILKKIDRRYLLSKVKINGKEAAFIVDPDRHHVLLTEGDSHNVRDQKNHNLSHKRA